MRELKINLLPPLKKTRLKRTVSFVFIKHLLLATLGTAAFLGITLLCGYITIVDEFSQLSQSAVSLSRSSSFHNQEARAANRTIRQFNLSSQNFLPISPYIVELARNLPGDIRLSMIEINREKQLLSVAGTAKTRDALINYQKILQKISWAETTQFPTTQLLEKTNIGFEYHAKLKQEFWLK